MSLSMQNSASVNGLAYPERRFEPRERVFKGAALSFNRGYSSFECVVRNRSDSGARLSIAETFELPRRVMLRIEGDAERPVEIRWSTASSLGVEFV